MNSLKSLSRRLPVFKSIHTPSSPVKPTASSPSSVSSASPAKAALAATTTRSATSTTAAMSAKLSANVVLEHARNRRTYYPLSKDLTITTERIQEIVKEALLHIPSSFNSQSNRVVVLFGAEHDKFWDITTEALKAIVPEDKWEPTGRKMAMFKGAAGTIMFFEDQTAVEGMQAKFPAYADKFPVWATQSDAMLQFTLWTALEAEGLGANLQHYSPIVDDKVAEAWKLPKTWRLNAQLVFGGRTAPAGDKTFMPLEERYKVFGA